MTELGVLSLRQFKLEEANQLLEKALAFYRKQRQTKAPDYSPAKLALASDYLGVVKFYYGDVAAARALMEDALQTSSGANLQGPERGIRAFNKGDTGALLVNLGELDRGETLIREALEEYGRISSQPHWEQGVTTYYLGIVAMRKNRLKEAEKPLLESEKILRQTLGDKNFYLASCLNQQAALLLLKNDLNAAEAKALEALTMLRESVPNNKLLWGTPMQTLGAILMKNGRSREGEDYYQNALAIYEGQPRKNYVSIAALKMRFSQALLAQNRLRDAEAIGNEGYEMAKQKLGSDNPITLAAAKNLAAIQAQEAKLTEAAK